MTREEALEYVNNMWMYEDTKNALETLIPEFGKAGSDKVIDYEEKYNEALERAKKLTSDMTTLQKIREFIFPELAESEDERIIDDAIQIIRASRLRCAEYGSEADKHLKAIAWLEKQKEPEPISFNVPYNPDDYEVVMQGNATGLKLKEQKTAEWNANDKAFIKDCARILDENGYAASADRLLSMFEQKPVQDMEEKEYVRTLKSLIADFLYGKDEIDRGYYQKIYDWLDGRHIKQEPEWSEEDNEMLECVIMDVESAKEKYLKSTTEVIRQGAIIADKELAWLKSLHPQPKQEWNEEDEAHRKFILESLEDQIRFCTKDAEGAYYAKQIRTAQNWLKSLRPSWKPSEEQQGMEPLTKLEKAVFDMLVERTNEITISEKQARKYAPIFLEIAKDEILGKHWKPSEEQMEAFSSYIKDFQEKAEAAVGGWNNFDVMIRLYEQLKKLI